MMDEMLISKIDSLSFTRAAGKSPGRGGNQFPGNTSYYDRLTTVQGLLKLCENNPLTGITREPNF